MGDLGVYPGIAYSSEEELTAEEKKLDRKEYYKKWYQENRDKKSEYMEKWRDENPDYNKKWRDENPDYNKKWYEENRDKKLEYNKKWYKENIEKKKNMIEIAPSIKQLKKKL